MASFYYILISSNINEKVRVTLPLCGEFTDHSGFSSQRDSNSGLFIKRERLYFGYAKSSLRINQHWFSKWLGAVKQKSLPPYLNQCWRSFLTTYCVARPQRVNYNCGLMTRCDDIVMGQSFLMAPSYSLGQCWPISAISKVQWHSSECNFTHARTHKNTSATSHYLSKNLFTPQGPMVWINMKSLI